MPYMCHFQVCSMAFWIPLDATLKPCNGWTSCRLSQLDGNREDLTLESLTPSRFFLLRGRHAWIWVNIEISLIIHPSHWPVPSKMLYFFGGDFDPIHPWSLTSGTWTHLARRFREISKIWQPFSSSSPRTLGVYYQHHLYIHPFFVGAPTKQVLWRSAPASRPSLRYWHLYLKISWCWKTTQNTRPW